MLSKIIKTKKEEIEYLKTKIPLSELKAKLRDMEGTRGFLNAISPSPTPHLKGVRDAGEGEKNSRQPATKIIAEIKKASPSKGIIREDFDPLKIAEIYQENGASAISVLTDKPFFLGDIEYLSKVKAVVTLPLLRKDFIIGEYQVFESRANGADAFLLIAAVLGKNQMEDYMSLGIEMGMSALIEVHTKEDIEKALSAGANLIGINNRDLSTFKVDIKTTEKLIQYIPDSVTVISESGIEKRDDIVYLQGIGADAFLIGEALMRERDIGEKLREFLSKA
ncbi:MAG: indole-3-glycerol phosphate synthase TrpC [Nitrospinae bacterium]|nr:indole-3-glycerol phosphate synthase TrpC [Nitrospinota bacterium]